VPFGVYDQLIERVADWLDRPDLEAEIPDFVRLTEVELAREVGWRFTNKEATGNFVADQDYISLPADHLWPEWLRVNTANEYTIPIVSGSEFVRLKRTIDAGGLQSYGARHVGQELKLVPTPGGTDGYTLWYQATISPLADEATGTSWLLANGFDAYLWGSLSNAADFIGDDARAGGWGMKFEKAKHSLKKLEFRARTGGGGLRVKTDVDGGTTPRRF
jgi:hypothetical protein